VYYKCVKFHKNPISGLGGVALTRYMDGRTDRVIPIYPPNSPPLTWNPGSAPEDLWLYLKISNWLLCDINWQESMNFTAISWQITNNMFMVWWRCLLFSPWAG
jgi:hypothetical protein